MEELAGKVAVVTGGASGIGRAMGHRFAAEGMRVMLADVEAPALEQTVAELQAANPAADIRGHVTDVRKYGDVEALRDATLAAYGAVHVVCNNAGIGAGAEGPLWEHERNDWQWAFDVNVWGVIHGINAFVPVMLAQGEDGHMVNTSSGNGGISALPSTPQYAVTKAAVVVLTECLYGQLEAAGAKVRASVLFPGPHMLRTGLFSSWRNRPAELAQEKPRRSPHITLDEYEAMMAAAGMDVEYTPVEEVAERVVAGIRAGAFWILPPSERTDETIRARAESMLRRENPDYLRALAG
jgi:NAD(P)-dependent dehydrogenase (short-subunit alcohol dehydrogenase family)